MERLKSISFYVVTAFILNALAYWMKSDFIGPFLKENITSILINLLAINIATCTILMAKLSEIKEKREADFTATFSELRFSLKDGGGSFNKR